MLNVQEPPRPEITPSKENNGPVEHALSLTGALSQADSTALPIPESDHLSKGFLDLDTKEGEEHFVASAKAQSRYWVPSDPAESAASPRAHTPPASPASEINYEASDKENHTVAKAAAPATPTKGAASSPAPAPAPSPVRLEGTSDARRKDAEAAAVAARERDVAAAFAGLPSVRPNWQHRYLKMIIVGDDGVGKTTFVRNLFAAYASDVDFPVADASGAGAAKVFGDAPERLCTELVLKDEEQQVWWHYLVQVRPLGWAPRSASS